jgi:hypothetical protein
MTLYYIQSKNEIINSEHIIRAKFEPEHIEPEGEDEYGIHHKERAIANKLSLWLTEIDIKNSYAYEDKVDGTASATAIYILRKTDAVRLWEAMKRDTYSI